MSATQSRMSSESPGVEPAAAAAPPILLAHADETVHARRAAAPDSSARGWLRVGGATLAGGRVTIDGASAGFAPLERALTIGGHNVVVNAPGSGQVLVRKTVWIGEDRTRLAPVRILR